MRPLDIPIAPALPVRKNAPLLSRNFDQRTEQARAGKKRVLLRIATACGLQPDRSSTRTQIPDKGLLIPAIRIFRSSPTICHLTKICRGPALDRAA